MQTLVTQKAPAINKPYQHIEDKNCHTHSVKMFCQPHKGLTSYSDMSTPLGKSFFCSNDTFLAGGAEEDLVNTCTDHHSGTDSNSGPECFSF